MSESRTPYFLIAGLSLGILLGQCTQPRAQAELASLWQARQIEQQWALMPFPVPAPAWGPPVREPVPEPPAARQLPIPESPALRILRESERCTVDWHSQRRKRPSRITCWAKS